MSNDPEEKRRRRPKKMTKMRLERQALHYLQRYPASEKHFRRVMRRKIQRAHTACPGESQHYEAWLNEVVVLCRRVGFLDDTSLANGLVRSYHRRGLSLRAISQKLREKGFETDVIDTCVQEASRQYGEVNVDLIAAIRYVKKRRFGCFYPRELNPDLKRKQLAALGRRGFSYGLSRDALDMDREHAETLLYQNEPAL